MVQIVADSTCDLAKETIEKYEISILPLHILLGENEYEDGISISPDEIYRWSDEHKETPKTSAISLEKAKEVISEALGKCDEVVCMAISGQMSSSVNAMALAANELGVEDKVKVVDSENLSTGIGLLVIEAAIMAKEGASASEIVAHLDVLKPMVRSSFVVDTLDYLYRGGRCSGLTALLGSSLHIHPQIVVEEGKMHSSKKYRGSMTKVLMDYAKGLEPALENARKERVFITHSGCDQADIDKLYDYLHELKFFDEILITRAGGVISSHCGPGTLGILFIENAPVE